MTITNPFDKSWIQALTLAAENPMARSVKPHVDLVNHLTQDRSDCDRAAAARSLWKFASEEGLGEILKIVPACQSHWHFDDDSMFDFQNPNPPAVAGFEEWSRLLGLEPVEVTLVADVNRTDWVGLVRKEAVRLQQSFSAGAFGDESTLHLPCTARWDGTAWSISFESANWLVVCFDGSVTVNRPTLDELDDRILWAMSEADKRFALSNQPKFSPGTGAWEECVQSLQPLHRTVLDRASSFSDWFRRVWDCVWPTVYREQNVLRGRADISLIRGELADCLEQAPQLTLWMFVFGKLVCETQTGSGLGFCADYGR